MTIDRTKRFSARVLSAFDGASLPATLAVRAAAAGQPAEIFLYDEISPWGVTATDFTNALASVGAGPIRVRINSPGGDVFDGQAIYNALLRHNGTVECVVDGIAASAASVVAMAGTTLAMHETSILMIHDAWGIVMGNRNDMAKYAGILAKIDGQMAAIYAAKTGAPVQDMAAAMDAETWYTAAEAEAAKFADSVIVAKPDAKAALVVPSFAARRLAPPSPVDEAPRNLALLRLRLAAAA